VPSTLHQFLIYWIDDEIEVVHVDTLTYISGYEFLSITKDGFVPVSVQLASEALLGDVGFQ
jgi:hypothetical protein